MYDSNLFGCVYLIHFDRPYKHAKHYIGFAEFGNLKKRIEEHRKGSGCNLIKVVNEAGIGWKVVRVWRNVDRNFERRKKNQGGASKCCPECKSKLQS